MNTVSIVVAVVYSIVCMLVVISLLRKEKNKLAVVFVIAALWPLTLPWGMSLAKKIEDYEHKDIFLSYRGAGFDTLKVKNGRWIAGFSVADMDQGGQLVLVMPGIDVAPEDLQEVIAQPCITAHEAILNSVNRQSHWLKTRQKYSRKAEEKIH